MAEFEARKAGDLEEITYTGTEDVPYNEGDELLPGATLTDLTGDGDEKRKLVQRREGVQITLKARDGKFHPHSAADEAALNAFGLPVAGKTSAKADETKGA